MIPSSFILPKLDTSPLLKINVDYYLIAREEHFLFAFVFLDHFNHSYGIYSSSVGYWVILH